MIAILMPDAVFPEQAGRYVSTPPAPPFRLEADHAHNERCDNDEGNEAENYLLGTQLPHLVFGW